VSDQVVNVFFRVPKLTGTDSIRSAASTVAYDLVSFYTGNNTGDVPGNLPDPYYWWEAGAFFGALINYWAFTGDSTYNNITVQAMEHQAGDKGDFMPNNQTYTEGNDDQCFWALSAMMAAERNFTNPSSSYPGWLAMVQAVFNEQANRWDTASCNGGLRWQIYTWNAGYNYKNTIANGCFFDIAARLARYTGNETYAEWATKSWNWAKAVGLITSDYQIFDGTTDASNCTSYDRTRWSYTAGIYLHGASVMYNYVSNSCFSCYSVLISLLYRPLHLQSMQLQPIHLQPPHGKLGWMHCSRKPIFFSRQTNPVFMSCTSLHAS
jgi:mannan endo-1,6-alpha-mannosidase